jgi:hypothetical protein
MLKVLNGGGTARIHVDRLAVPTVAKDILIYEKNI